MNNTPKILFNRIESFKDNDRFVDLAGLEFMNNDEMAQILSKFRSPKAETFRVIYMKGNQVKGYESITSNIPNFVNLSNISGNNEKVFNRFRSQKERLNADGYYLMHNHCSESSKPSNDDVRMSDKFRNELEGFKGHMVMSLTEYSFIRENEDDELEVDNPISLKSINVEDCLNKLQNDSIYNFRVDSRTNLIALSEKIEMDKDSSNVIITNCKCEPRLVIQMPNHMINFEKEQLNGYIKNLAKSVGGTRAFFSTTDLETYTKSLEHLEFGTLKDSILFQRENDKLCVREKPDVISNKDLFEVSKVNFEDLIKIFERNEIMNNKLKENSSIYDYIPQELDEVPEGKIRVLLKEVGKDPVIKVINDTLEDKQKLVDGLIEIVPYEDLLLVCNEEGKILNQKPNLAFDYDYIAGNCFFIGDDYENARFKSITREQIISIIDDLKERSFEYEELDEFEIDDDDEVR